MKRQASPELLDEALEDGDREGRAVAADELERPAHRRHVPVGRLLGQEAADLEVGIDPRLELPEQLEHQPVAEDDRGVALLGAHHAHRELLARGAPEHPVDAAARGDELGAPAELGAERPALADRLEEGPAEGGVGHRVVEHAVAFAAGFGPGLGLDPGERRPGALPRQPLALLAWREGERQGVGLRLVVEVVDAHEGEDRPARRGAARAVAVDRHHGGQLDAAHPPALAAEPAAAGEDAGQDRLETAPAGAGEALGPAPGEGEDRQLRSLARRRPRPLSRQRAARALSRGGRLGGEREPVEAVGAQGEQVGQLADLRERRAPEQLGGHDAAELRQVELDVLDEAREVGDHQDPLAVVAADERQDAVVVGLEELDRAPAEGLVALAQGDHPAHPPELRVGVRLLGLDVDRLVVVLGVDDHRQVELVRVGVREAGVSVRAPLHRGAHAVPVAQVVVVAHADLVAVVDDRRAGQGHQEGVHQLDAAPVVAQQRRQPPADPQVDPRLRLGGVNPVHVVPVLVGHHLERELVVVAQEDRPLAGLGDRRGLLQDVDDREPVLHAHRHEQARHDREVERHVALVARAEVLDRVLRPLVGLGEEHPVLVAPVDVGAELLQVGVGLGQVLAVRALALEEVGDGVEAHAVDPHVEPEVEGPEHLAPDVGRREVEVGLVVVEAVPVVGAGHRVPGPVRGLEVLEDDARVLVALGGLAPDVVVAVAASRLRAPGALEPGVLVRGVVDHQLGDHPEAPAVGLAQEAAEGGEVAVHRVDPAVVGDVVALVLERRGVERQQPEGGDPQLLEVVELAGEAGEVADAVAVGVRERAHVELVDDGVLVPEGLVREERAVAGGSPGLGGSGALGGHARVVRVLSVGGCRVAPSGARPAAPILRGSPGPDRGYRQMGAGTVPASRSAPGWRISLPPSAPGA